MSVHCCCAPRSGPHATNKQDLGQNSVAPHRRTARLACLSGPRAPSGCAPLNLVARDNSVGAAQRHDNFEVTALSGARYTFAARGTGAISARLLGVAACPRRSGAAPLAPKRGALADDVGMAPAPTADTAAPNADPLLFNRYHPLP